MTELASQISRETFLFTKLGVAETDRTNKAIDVLRMRIYVCGYANREV